MANGGNGGGFQRKCKEGVLECCLIPAALFSINGTINTNENS